MEKSQSLSVYGNYTQAQVDTIKATVAKGATNEELSMFMSLATKYDLDPFAKEIWFVKSGDKPMIMAARDGFLKLAQRDPKFKGIQSFAVYENDEFSIDPVAGSVSHKPKLKDRGQLVGAWCRVVKDGLTPYISWVELKEYRKTSPTWSSMPSVMIQKVAQTVALRMMFGLSGIYAPEEIEESPAVRERKAQAIPVEEVQELPKEDPIPTKTEKVEKIPKITAEQIKKIHTVWNEIEKVKELTKERSEQVYKANLKKLYDVESSKELTKDQAMKLIEKLENLVYVFEKEKASKELSAQEVADIVNGEVLPLTQENHDK